MSPTEPCQPIAVPIPRIERLRFRCVAEEPIQLAAYSGSAWRGLLGWALRQSVCVTRQPRCDGCLLQGQCVYSTFFETPPTAPETTGRYSALPHPFVLEPEVSPRRAIPPGDALQLGITLIGPAGDLLPYLVHAMQRAGERGLNRQGGRFRLVELAQEQSLGGDDWRSIYQPDQGTLAPLRTAPATLGSCPQPLALRLLTPLRIKRHGHFVGARQLTAADLLGTLTTRLARLADLYQPDAIHLDRPAIDAAIAATQITARDLHWYEWTRWSSRQRSRMQLGGLIGHMTLDGPGLPALWPLIWLGQWLHVGKATSFGLGRYQVAASPTDNRWKPPVSL